MNTQFPDHLAENPLAVAQDWLAAATRRGARPNPNSITLATVAADGQPAARVVLCKNLVADPGYLVFHTNYLSRKGRELADADKSAAVFHWDEVGQQVRIEGHTVKAPASESDEYFANRHWRSQLGAWASEQSEPLLKRSELLVQTRRRAAELGLDLSDDATELKTAATIPRPPHWGGYRLWATSVELWLQGVNREHDRAVWRRSLQRESEYSYSAGPWTVTRLQP